MLILRIIMKYFVENETKSSSSETKMYPIFMVKLHVGLPEGKCVFSRET